MHCQPSPKIHTRAQALPVACCVKKFAIARAGSALPPSASALTRPSVDCKADAADARVTAGLLLITYTAVNKLTTRTSYFRVTLTNIYIMGVNAPSTAPPLPATQAFPEPAWHRVGKGGARTLSAAQRGWAGLDTDCYLELYCSHAGTREAGARQPIRRSRCTDEGRQARGGTANYSAQRVRRVGQKVCESSRWFSAATRARAPLLAPAPTAEPTRWMRE